MRNKSKGILSTGALLALVVQTGCATLEFGRDFDPHQFEAIVKRGETNTQQVKALLGAPTSQGIVVENDGSRYTRWLYYYGKGRIHKMENAQLKTMEVRFDASDKVASYSWSAE